jgi:hypothetical protein
MFHASTKHMAKLLFCISWFSPFWIVVGIMVIKLKKEVNISRIEISTAIWFRKWFWLVMTRIAG